MTRLLKNFQVRFLAAASTQRESVCKSAGGGVAGGWLWGQETFADVAFAEQAHQLYWGFIRQTLAHDDPFL